MKPRFESIVARSLATLGACTLIALLLTCALPSPVAAETAPAAARQFSDISGGEEYATAVNALADKGIVQGRPDGSFGPTDSLTRAQMAVFLARALGLPDSPMRPFLDVKDSDWFAGAVGALCERGLVQGTSQLTFSPDRPINRQQATTLVMRALDYALQNGAPLSAGTAVVDVDLPTTDISVWLAGFRDRPLIDQAHRLSVANAYRLGVIHSQKDGWLFPGFNLTRSQMALMLHRAFLQPVSARNTYPLDLPAVPSYPPLSSGATGSLVAALEAKLAALGYACGPVDATYDYRTRDAVMAFEKVERLARNGKMDGKDWLQLQTARTPSPRRTDVDARCEVDLTRQVLLMITDNRVWKAVHVSTGKLGTRTGHFSIGAKYEGWVKCVTLDGEMYYPSYVVSKTAIHGYRSVPPYPASHGCVRVPVWTAEELYRQLPKGTVIDIYY